MLHPTAKSRLICVRRLFLDPFIKFFLKVLSTLLPTGINDMTISLGNHFRLCMTGVTLYGLDVATGQHQFVTDAAMSQTMKGHYRKSKLQQLLFQQTGQSFLRKWSAIGIPQNQIRPVSLDWFQCFFPLLQCIQHIIRQLYRSDAGFGLGAFQHRDRPPFIKN